MSDLDDNEPEVIGFWKWLFTKDSEGDIGISNLLDKWNLFGILFSIAFALYAEQNAADLAKNFALPSAAVLVGLSFAWAGRSSSLLQDKEFSEFIIEKGAPAEGYVYSFQLAILTVMVMIAISIILSSKIYVFGTGSYYLDSVFNRFILTSLGWLSLRECWGAISFANKLSIQFYQVRERKLREAKLNKDLFPTAPHMP